MKIATAAWPLERHTTWASYREKLSSWIKTADADLIVFPEYSGMEPSLGNGPSRDTPNDWVDHTANHAIDMLDLHRDLCGDHYILVGSCPVRDNEKIVNRAWLIGPNGEIWHQDKQVLTPWERTHSHLVSGDPLALAQTSFGTLGTLICYDSEFPPLAHALSPDILLVPSCTDTEQGATRVRNAARARALEIGAVTVLSQTLGDVPGCCFLETNKGRAGLYVPPDQGLPDNGILAESAPNTPGWARADVPSELLGAWREGQGDVSIPLDWPMAQERAALIQKDRQPSF